MLTPYYQNTGIAIYHGDCREILPAMTGHAIVTDPPYGEHQEYAGDNGRVNAIALLENCLTQAVDRLTIGAHIAFFWTMRSLDQAIETAKATGLTYRRVLTMYLPKGGARPYLGWLPRTQPIVLVQKHLPNGFHTELATHVSTRIDEMGFTRAEIARRLGCDSRLVMKWSRVGDPAWCLPTPRFYPALKALLLLDAKWDMLVDRPPAVSTHRGDYTYHHDCYVVNDIRTENNGHPSPKPLSVIRHLVETLTTPDEVVIDPFLGSGTTLVAAKQLGRRAIGIEVEERFCEMAAQRLTHEDLLREAGA